MSQLSKKLAKHSQEPEGRGLWMSHVQIQDPGGGEAGGEWIGEDMKALSLSRRVPLECLLCGTGHGWGDLRCPGPPPAQPHWSRSLWARQHADSREGTRVFLELLPNPFSGKMAPLVPQSVNWMWLFIHVPVVSQKCVIILWFDFLIYKGGKTKRRFVVGWWVMHMKGPEKPGDEIGSWHFSLLPFRLLEPFGKD